MATTVTSKGQVTIPKPVRDRLGIEPGSAVEFEMTPQGDVVLRKAGSVARPPGRFDRMRGTATARLTTEQIMALTRGEQ